MRHQLAGAAFLIAPILLAPPIPPEKLLA